MTKKFEPAEIGDVLFAFPAGKDFDKLIPSEVPMAKSACREIEKSLPKWAEFFGAFFAGLVDIDSVQLYPKKGVDARKAWRHIITIMRSYQPSHERKIAACCYLLDLWFKKVHWQYAKKEQKA